ncbi:dynamin family protein [Campylobacter lari]|uniref:dynamin family protein n=1 Tax=Campylobacter lari TaxID=201 RepID=UPI0008BDA6B5|nr:dynamin family protein [Campylobacter lari]EAJ0334232.1 ATP-binding protein [Campylobacter lari]QKF74906.1 GTP-binding protein (dynamin domain) [Campylobacter lari subsp. lari]QQT72265.1 dynamin family protein [Campylobacter lari]TXE69101.1 ATP-binding protein [Campylobacter lari]SES90879.1 Dynamin family protein [Campylobacter lari subsp. lari]
MQNDLINDFLKAYENAYCKSFDDSFEGKILAIKNAFLEPSLHLNDVFLKDLEMIIASYKRAINVAIIGQFSSGKSTLLNLILQKECLPTGVVPVTFKPTFLRYAREYFLRVEYEDGSDEIVDINELAKFSDQRNKLKETKSLHLFAPIELLKDITLIDTPGLNANTTDTLTTFQELSFMHSAIWLSLIDNAGKKSEEDAIRANAKLLERGGICVLNQKDKLNQDELENVLNYAHLVFDKYFEKIIAISCKEAKYDLQKSNLPLLYEYLKGLDYEKIKKDFIKEKLNDLCELLLNQYIFLQDILEQLELKFNAILHSFKANVLEQKIKILNHNCLDKLKLVGEKISQEILKFIKEKDSNYYKEAKGLFKKNLYEKITYKAPYLSSDDAFLAMFYNSETMNKEFKKLKSEIALEFNQIKNDFSSFFTNLEEQILLFKAKFSNLQKENDLESDEEFANFRSFASASEELFLKDFKELLFKSKLELDLFLEKLNLKALANYESATKLTLGFFSTKMSVSKEFYELDSTEFSLYYPKASEVYQRVLTELNVYEFEDLLINKPTIMKIFKDYMQSLENLIQEKKVYIKNLIIEFENKKTMIEKIKSQISKL